MMWLLVPLLWCAALVPVIALCRAGYLEDVARGFVDPVPPLVPRQPTAADRLVRR